MRKYIVFSSLSIVTLLFSGCAQTSETSMTESITTTYESTNTVDTVVNDSSEPSDLDTDDSTRQDQGFVYMSTWLVGEPPDDIATEVYRYSLSSGKSEKIFAEKKTTVIDVTGEGKIVYHNNVSLDTPMVVYQYDPKTQKSEKLFEVDKSHDISAIVTPDGKYLLYTDRCGIFCTSEEKTAIVSLLNLSNKEKKVVHSVYHTSEDNKYDPGPSFWLNNSSVFTVPIIDAGEGSVYSYGSTLNIDTGVLNLLELHDAWERPAPLLDGQGVMYSSFDYNPNTKVVDSRINLTNFYNQTSTVVASTDKEFLEVFPLDSGHVVSHVVKMGKLVEEVYRGWTVEGEHAIQIIDSAKGFAEDIDLAADPVALVAVQDRKIYYHAKGTGDFGSILRMYNYNTKEDILILESPRYISVLAIHEN